MVQLEGVIIARNPGEFRQQAQRAARDLRRSRGCRPCGSKLRGSFMLDFLYEGVGVDVHVANVLEVYQVSASLFLPTMHKRILLLSASRAAVPGALGNF